jgi:hypothetical protein
MRRNDLPGAGIFGESGYPAIIAQKLAGCGEKIFTASGSVNSGDILAFIE